jgi:hypothetical protein
MDLQLHIPDDVANVLTAEYANLPQAAVEALALEGYRSLRLSEGNVRQMLGLSSRLQVHAFLKAHGVPLHYSLADLEQDRETSRQVEEKVRRTA